MTKRTEGLNFFAQLLGGERGEGEGVSLCMAVVVWPSLFTSTFESRQWENLFSSIRRFNSRLCWHE